MSKRKKLLAVIARYVGYPLAWIIVAVYMTFESLWAVVSDWIFSYTPLRLFSERIHQHLVGRSKWLVLFVYLTHFALMQGMALLSGKMLLQGFLSWGVLFYIGKGLVAIPTVRFFVQEKDRLMDFWPIRAGYQLVVFIKSSSPYRQLSKWILTLKEQLKQYRSKFFSNKPD